MSIQTYEIVEEFESLGSERWEITVFRLMEFSDELVCHEQALDLREGLGIDSVPADVAERVVEQRQVDEEDASGDWQTIVLDRFGDRLVRDETIH